MDYVTFMCTEPYNDTYPVEDTRKKRKIEYIIAQEQNHPICIEIIYKSYNEYGKPSGREIYCISKKHSKMYKSSMYK